MLEFLLAVLGLFDGTLTALMAVPVFSFLLVFLLFFAVLGLFLTLKDAAVGKRGKRNGI